MAVYFASDVHLGSGDPATARTVERRFAAWLDAVSGDAAAIFLVGDIFDVWFESRRVIPSGCVRILGKLAELADRGIRIVFFTGNHDMWTGDCLARECGVEIYTSPQVMELHGRRLFIAHGDNMQINGQPVLKFLNRVFRSRVLRWLVSRIIHPDLFVRFGRWWSGRSRKSNHAGGAPVEAMTEPLIAYAREYAAGHKIDHFVFGHVHFARDFRDGSLHTVHLGCWEQTPTYAVLDDAGELTLKRFEP